MPFEEIAGEMSVRRGVNTLATACTFVGHARAASAALHWNGWLFPGWPQAVNKGDFMCGRGHDYCVHGRTDWLDAAMAADWRAVVTCQWLLGAQHTAIAIIRLIITQQVVHVCMPGPTSMGHVQLLLPAYNPKTGRNTWMRTRM